MKGIPSKAPRCPFRSVGFWLALQYNCTGQGWLSVRRLCTGWSCKFYQGDVVKIGTTASRFTLKVPADEVSWFATRLRAELIRRELAKAAGLQIDEAGEAAMAAKAAAAAAESEKRAARKQAATEHAASPRRKAAAQVEAAAHHERLAAAKRTQAECDLAQAKLDSLRAKVARAAPLAAQLANVTPAAAVLQTKLESFMKRTVQSQEPKV